MERAQDQKGSDEAGQLLSGGQQAAALNAIVTLALNTGMKKGGIKNLKWQDVDFQNNQICILEQKNGKKDYIPLNEPTRRALLGVKRNSASPYVFCNEEGRRPQTYFCLS